MIVIQAIGGLGNQLFQYAAAKAMAIEQRKKLQIDIDAFEYYKLHSYALNHFTISASVYKKSNPRLKKICNFFCKKVNYKESDFGFNPALSKIRGCAIYLEGYFQSEKYFNKYEAVIRREFTVASPLKDLTKQTLRHIESVISVSIHIRRGDYLNNPLHNTDKEDFYFKAMKIIEEAFENPVYFVFSDDIEWAKNNFITNKETVYIDFNDASTNFEDLKLMSACQHNIIANSSFSWWGAWLNANQEKKVIAPKKWFNDDAINSDDIIPENWIKL